MQPDESDLTLQSRAPCRSSSVVSRSPHDGRQWVPVRRSSVGPDMTARTNHTDGDNQKNASISLELRWTDYDRHRVLSCRNTHDSFDVCATDQHVAQCMHIGGLRCLIIIHSLTC